MIWRKTEPDVPNGTASLEKLAMKALADLCILLKNYSGLTPYLIQYPTNLRYSMFTCGL